MSQPDLIHIITLLRALFYSFLGMTDIVAFDSACMQRESREQFLASLVNTPLCQLNCTVAAMNWVLRRKVLPGSIAIGKLMSETDAILLTEVTSCVQEIHMFNLWELTLNYHIACLPKLVSFCPRLRRVVFHPDNNPFNNPAFLGPRTVKIVQQLANSCPSLTQIELHDHGFSSQSFRMILSRCRSISTLDVRDCSKLMEGRSLSAVVELCPQLESLTLNNTYRLEEFMLEAIATQCTKLKCLHILEYGDHVMPGGFSRFVKVCPPLEALSLSGKQTDYADVLLLFTRCAGVKHLVLGGLRCIGAPGTGWSQPTLALTTQLQTIELQSFNVVSSLAAKTLAQYCPHLRAIDIKDVHDIAEDAVVVLATQCSTDLRSLELSRYRNVAPHTLTVIAHRYTCLEKLTIAIANPTETSFHQLATRCTQLIDLHITFSEPVQFGRSAPHLRTLQHLKVSYSQGNCDASVLACVTHCTQLRSLCVAQCGRCKEQRIVRAIQRNCPRLTTCNLNNCTGAVIRALVALQTERARHKVYFEFFAYNFSDCCM